jgi:lipopolysaccharide transport system ATP-binding protein
MYVRLAFAVAAHLDPDVLIVDEVLAVGDADFQKKCIGRMDTVAREGRTVLFVSHNMGAVRSLCGSVALLEGGRLARVGDTMEVTEEYLQGSLAKGSAAAIQAAVAALPLDRAFRMRAVEVRQGGTPRLHVVSGESVEIEIRYLVLEPTRGLRVFVELLGDSQDVLISSYHDDDAQSVSVFEPGEYVSVASIPADLLSPRIYELAIEARIGNGRWLTGQGVRLPLRVEASGRFNMAYRDVLRAKLQPRVPWETTRTADLTSHSNMEA